MSTEADMGSIKNWRISSALAVLLLLAMALGTGCDGCPGDDRDDLEQIRADGELVDEQTVAVVRMASFDWNHFDTQHWIAEGVEAGVFRDRDDLEHGIPDNPTRQLREFVEALIGDEMERLNWEGTVDVVVWKPDDEDQTLRWAVSIPRGAAGFPPAGQDQFSRGGRLVDADGEEGAVVYRSDSDDGHTWLADVESATDDGESALLISNFAEGIASLPPAVELTGASANKPVEAYLWPTRTGLVDRYEMAGVVVDRELAVGGHDQPAVRLGVIHAAGQLMYALGEPDSWPEQIRLAMDVQRDEETDGAESVELIGDVDGSQTELLSLLAEAMDGESTRRLERFDDDSAQIDLTADPGLLSRVVDEMIEPAWFRVATGRSQQEIEEPRAALDEMLAQIDGAASFAFYDSPLPMGYSGEMFVAVEVDDEEAMMETAAELHPWLLKEFWMPVLDLGGHIHSETHELELGDETLELDHDAFIIGHGFRDGGVCYTSRDGEYVAYYGVHPCDRLTEILDNGVQRQSEPDAPLSYRGSLQGMVNRLYAGAGEQTRDIFGDIELEVQAHSTDDEMLRVKAEVDDLVWLAMMLDGFPRLGKYWEIREYVDVDALEGPLALNTPVYQEPSMAVLGPPGGGFGLTAGVVLGMPFSHPPIAPMNYRQFFFAGPDAEPELGHSH